MESIGYRFIRFTVMGIQQDLGSLNLSYRSFPLAGHLLQIPAFIFT